MKKRQHRVDKDTLGKIIEKAGYTKQQIYSTDLRLYGLYIISLNLLAHYYSSTMEKVHRCLQVRLTNTLKGAGIDKGQWKSLTQEGVIERDRARCPRCQCQLLEELELQPIKGERGKVRPPYWSTWAKNSAQNKNVERAAADRSSDDSR